MDENFQPTKFFVRTDYEASGLNNEESEILSMIANEPVSVAEINSDLRRNVPKGVLDSLIQKRLVQAIGFTPTDALHVLGIYDKWDTQASEAGAVNLARYTTKGKYDLCTYVRELVAENMGADLMSYILPHHPREIITDLFSGKYPAKFKVEIPVVLLGGPSRAYDNELSSLIDAEVVVPEFADVGNAVGALAGKGVKRIEVMIRPASLENPDEDFLVFSPVGRERFKNYGDAVEFTTNLGKELVLDYEIRCGIIKQDTKITVSKKTVSPDDWSHPPLETKVIVVGIGNPMMILKE
jgi:N-methylhydantoinase A/oxoprolinase/acetone carboxylase beta subunit